MTKILWIIPLISVLLTAGCFDYNDMNKLFFTTLNIYDADEKGNVYLYTENFKAYRGEGEKAGTERRVLFKGTGKTIFDAFENMNKSTSFPLEYSQSKALIFTERAAKYGLNNFIDITVRNQRANIRRFIFIYPGDPEKLLNVKIGDEQFIGIFLENSMLSQGKVANMVRLRTDDLAYKRLMGSKVYIIPIIDKIHEPSKERIEISKAAVIKDDKMVDKLNNAEVKAFNYMNNTAKKGALVTENPEHKDRFISLVFNKTSFKKALVYDGSKVKAKRTIKIRVSIQEVQESISLTNEVRKQIAKDTEERIKKDCQDLFNKYKEKGIDIFNIQRDFEIKYPSEKIEDVLDKTDMNVEVKINIEGSQNTTDFR